MCPAKVLLVFLLVSSAPVLPAQTTGNEADPGESDPLATMQSRNALLEEQIKLATNQQKLAQLYFPAIPQPLESNFVREGLATLRGSVAAFESLQKIAKDIVERIKKDEAAPEKCKAGKPNASSGPILIQGQHEAAAVLELLGTMAQLELLEKSIEDALNADKARSADTEAIPKALAPIALLGPALQVAVDILKFFRKTTSISSITVDPDEAAIAAMLSAELKAPEGVFATGQFPPGLTDIGAGGDLIKQLERLRGQVKKIQVKIQGLETAKEESDKCAVKSGKLLDKESKSAMFKADIEHFERLHIASSGEERTRIEELLKLKREEKRLVDLEIQEDSKRVVEAQAESKRLAAAIKQWTDLRDSVNVVLSAISEQGTSDSALAAHLRAERVLKVMKEDGAGVLQVKVHLAGAEIKRTGWLGRTREASTGGAIASYLFYDAKTGEIRSSGTFAVGPPEKGKPTT